MQSQQQSAKTFNFDNDYTGLMNSLDEIRTLWLKKAHRLCHLSSLNAATLATGLSPREGVSEELEQLKIESRSLAEILRFFHQNFPELV